MLPFHQNNFFKSIRHFVIDLTHTSATSGATGIHWQVAQATTLVDIVVNMSTDASTNHQGIYMENGSGGYMNGLIMNGGQYGINVGNQQFTGKFTFLEPSSLIRGDFDLNMHFSAKLDRQRSQNWRL